MLIIEAMSWGDLCGSTAPTWLGKHDSSAGGSPSSVDLHVWWLEKRTKSCPGDGSWESWCIYCGRKSKFTRSASKQRTALFNLNQCEIPPRTAPETHLQTRHTSKCGRNPHREVLAEKIGPQIFWNHFLRFLLKSCKQLLPNPKPRRRAMRQSSKLLLQSPWPLSPHASE